MATLPQSLPYLHAITHPSLQPHPSDYQYHALAHDLHSRTTPDVPNPEDLNDTHPEDLPFQLTKDEITETSDNFSQRIAPVLEYLDRIPSQRRGVDLTSLMLATQDLINDIRSMFYHVPHSICHTWLHEAMHTREMLEKLEQNLMPEDQWVHRPRRYETRTGRRGAPRVFIDLDVLERHWEVGFTAKMSASLLNTSKSTVRRRRKDLGLKARERSQISDLHLGTVISEILDSTDANLGHRNLIGGLRYRGIWVSRERVRILLRAQDPQRLADRFAKAIKRRDYYVPFINSLWHMDGHHKLIRWKFVIHGAIDGKSHCAVMMHVSDNNKAETVAAAFKKATDVWGWPSRLRCDHGGENLIAGRMMEERRGPDRSSFMQGRSVHNQRIERLWRNVRESCTGQFERQFKGLEEEGLLDPSNPLHLWCLHQVYGPLLQRSLDEWVGLWNHHPMSTKGLRGLSPKQQWQLGKEEAALSGYELGLDDHTLEVQSAMINNFEEFGWDQDGEPEELTDYDIHVHVVDFKTYLPQAFLDPEVTNPMLMEVLPLIQWPPPRNNLGDVAYQRCLELAGELLFRSKVEELSS